MHAVAAASQRPVNVESSRVTSASAYCIVSMLTMSNDLRRRSKKTYLPFYICHSFFCRKTLQLAKMWTEKLKTEIWGSGIEAFSCNGMVAEGCLLYRFYPLKLFENLQKSFVFASFDHLRLALGDMDVNDSPKRYYAMTDLSLLVYATVHNHNKLA